ncbi:MAG: TonB family protein [Tenuifilaceae bacterium]|jgi:TonB family protein|uniref:TonB family protein n=1 Tax=Perlabentimonas gracilis TaxID=2715279 RepID=UPI00140DA6F2|nr:TonB family protein [Perlabentimonas gracilis]MDX9770087.1 TonB family protein [Tenuifilaceae bacterium]NHB67811.1 TonB family protein [Perlabentimonas gracilis]
MSDKTKGIVGSTIIHITIMVLLILFGFSTPLPLPGEEGILINFGTSDQGSGLREPRPAPQQAVTPTQRPQEQSEQTPLSQDFEEAPSLPDPVKPTPTKPAEEKPAEKPKEETKPEEEKPREVDRRALFPGQRTDGDTSGEGQTGTEGNQGSTEGSVDSQSREGGTVSGGDGISFSLGGRSALQLPTPEYPSQKSGTVVVEVTVDRNGNVTNARGGVRGSTTNDTELINAAERAARRAKFDVSQNAPAYQTGTITYVFKLR